MKLRRRARSGYTAGFSWPILLGAAAAGALVAAIWPSLWRPELPPRYGYPAAAVLAVASVLLAIRNRRGPANTARSELRAAAASRTRGVWLDRDSDQVFTVTTRWPRWCRIWYIDRADGGSARDLDLETGHGEVPLLTEEFVIIPFARYVVYGTLAMLVHPDTGEIRSLPSPGLLKALRANHKAAKDGLGTVIAAPELVATAAAQLGGSELVANEEEDP